MAPAVTTPDFGRRCADCRHRLGAGTCAEPERAGLIAAGAGFGIAWPPQLHATTCPAFVNRRTAQEAPAP